MYSSTLISIIVIITNLKAISGQQCPPNYVLCSQKGGSCNIASQITSGYISLGNSNQFTLTPFIKNIGVYSVICDDKLGNIKSTFYSGTDISFCCVGEDKIGFSTDYINSQYLFPSNNINVITVSHFEQYLTSAPTLWYFTLHLQSYKVGGFHNIDPPSSLLNIDNNLNWRYCGNLICDGLIPGQPTWIKMVWPSNQVSKSRLVIPGDDGSVDCQHKLYDDTSNEAAFAPNDHECYRAEGETHIFTTNTGYWHRVIHCSGCDSSQYRLSTGITSSLSNTVSTSFTDTFQTSVLSGFEFKQEIEISDTLKLSSTETISTTITGGYTSTMARSLSQSMSLKTEETKVINCQKDGLYQWIFTTLDYQIVTSTDGVLYTIYGSEYECIDGNIPPQCVPGDCADIDCQTCLTMR